MFYGVQMTAWWKQKKNLDLFLIDKLKSKHCNLFTFRWLEPRNYNLTILRNGKHRDSIFLWFLCPVTGVTTFGCQTSACVLKWLHAQSKYSDLHYIGRDRWNGILKFMSVSRYNDSRCYKYLKVSFQSRWKCMSY